MSKSEDPVSVTPRRRFLQTTVLGSAGTALLPALAGAREMVTNPPVAPRIRPSELDELAIADLQAAFTSGKFSSLSVTQKYMARIEEIDRRGHP